MNTSRIKVLVDFVKATFAIAAQDKDVAETKETYELIKLGCEANSNFKRGVELYLMEYALKVEKEEKGRGEVDMSFEELMKELKGAI
jgi:hypothetical protein